MFSLQGEIALVTGGGRGIGRAIAEAYAKAGADVAVSARTEAELAETSASIRTHGVRALALAADLSKRADVAALIPRVAETFGPVSILVNNAGIGSSANPKPVAGFDDEFWDLSLELNLTTPYRLSKAVLPSMQKKRYGRIINISSINGKMPSLHGAAYAASKHGLLGLTRTLAMEVAKEGITVNAICPGPVRTVMNDKRIEYDAKRKGISVEAVAEGMTPIGGRLEPEDIAPMAVYLASREARMVTGQAYNVCGGVLIY